MRLLLLMVLSLPLELIAQQATIPVYEGSVPCADARTASSRTDGEIGRVLTYVDEPRLEYYAPLPRAARSTALMIIPGGGYAVQAYDHEGTDIARYFSALGYHAFILSHRLPMTLEGDCKSTAALADAQQGLRKIRSLADSLGYASDRVGVMGFSAGGHLAGSASVYAIVEDSVSSRPDFSILVYPVTLMNAEKQGHAGSQANLLGPEPSAADLRRWDLPSNIDPATPPTILIHASDDEGVVPENSLAYYRALLAQGVAADLRIYATGGHGFGSAREREAPVRSWLEEVAEWLSLR